MVPTSTTADGTVRGLPNVIAARHAATAKRVAGVGVPKVHRAAKTNRLIATKADAACDPMVLPPAMMDPAIATKVAGAYDPMVRLVVTVRQVIATTRTGEVDAMVRLALADRVAMIAATDRVANVVAEKMAPQILMVRQDHQEPEHLIRRDRLPISRKMIPRRQFEPLS